MAKKSRLNPNPASRPTLRDLQQGGILRREMNGLRNIIRATTGAIDPFGHDVKGIHDFIQTEPSLNNFRHNTWRVKAFVGYNGGRAEIIATTECPVYYESSNCLNRQFPVNGKAMRLLGQPCTRGHEFDPNRLISGDAILITDRRLHWVLGQRQASDDEIIDLDAQLTTPRRLYKRYRTTEIVFLEEPNQRDIFAIKLLWQ